MDDALFSAQGRRTLIICLDRTHSMKSVIEALKQFLVRYVIKRIAAGYDEIERVGLVTIDDHYRHGHQEDVAYQRQYLNREDWYYPGESAYESYGLTENLEEFGYWLTTIQLGDGADLAEAIACGVDAGLRLGSDASIWLVTDAAPHGAGIVYGNDTYSTGCPCYTPMPAQPLNVLFVESPSAMRGARLYYEQRGDRVVVVEREMLGPTLAEYDPTAAPAQEEVLA